MSSRNAPRIAALLACLALPLAALAAEGEFDPARRVRVGVYDFEPLVAASGPRGPRGLYVDLLALVAREEAWQVEHVAGTWDECLRRLHEGEIDLLPVIGWSEERARALAYGDEVPVVDWGVVYARRSGGIETVFDLRGKRIAALKGSIYTHGFRTLLDQFGLEATLVEKPDYRAVFRAIQDGEVDAGINAQIYGSLLGDEFQLVQTPVVFSPVKLGYAVQRGSGNEALLAALDRRFAALRADPGSAWYALRHRWLGTGGNGRALPRWASTVLWAAAATALLAVVFALALRRQVAARTRELALANQQLLASRKLEAIGRLAGGVAHDFNNLLTPILAYGSLLREEFPPGDERHELAREIELAGRRAKDLVKQLLAFGRRQALQTRPVDLNAVVSGFEGLLRRTLREDVALELALAPSLPAAMADVVQLEQVIMNLAVNGQDAMPGGGRLVLETRAVTLDEAYARAHRDVRPGEYVMLAVSDTGHGMDPDTMDRVFDPFFTTKEKGKGTGLGLATVYGIVRQHGGHIWVYSEPGKGSAFKIYFPAARARPEVPEAPRAAPADLRGGETVMVVEDNDLVRALAERALERLGYRVLSARGGRDCLARLDGHDGPLHLLLTDVVMPDLNGRALFERVTARFPSAAVLYMSGYTDNVIVHHGVLEPGIHFLQKPFTADELGAKVRQVLAGT